MFCAAHIPSLSCEVFAVENSARTEAIQRLDADRERLLNIFAQVSVNAGNLDGATAEEVAKRNPIGDRLQVFFALKVFEQLGLITFENGKLEVFRGVKTKLENSPLYNTVTKYGRH